MKDHRRQQLVEEYEEIALSLLIDEYANDEGARLLQKYEEAKQNGELAEIPDELDAKCRKLINHSFAAQMRRTRLKKLGSSVVKAAVLMVVMLGLSAALVLSVDAFRVPVLNFLMDRSGEYSKVVLDSYNSDEAQEDNWVVERFEKSIPGTYVITKHAITEYHGTVVAEDLDAHVIYLQYETNKSELNVDAEDIEYISVEFGGYHAVSWIKDGFHLMWLDHNSNTLYTLFAEGLDNIAFWKFAYALIG